MHATSSALEESLEHQTYQGTVTITPTYPVRSFVPAEPTLGGSTQRADSGYHFITCSNEDGDAIWHIVNEHGVPDNTLTNFARTLACSIGMEQVRTQLVPLLSYLSEQAERGLPWYAPASCLQAVWQDFLHRNASCWKTNDGNVTVLTVSVKQRRDLYALHSMLTRFYTFAIDRATYGYQHPFAGQQHFIYLPMPAQLRSLFRSRLSTWHFHR